LTSKRTRGTPSLRASSSSGTPHRGGFQTILFTDLEASTPLTQRLGDEGAQKLLRGHNAAVRGALDEHGGREVKHTGDGIMASFPSAVAAVTAALQIQRELAGGEVRVRVGLNAGEPIAEDDDLFGLSVIKAARVADRAEPGQVLVSRVVRELCEGKTFQFSSLGEVQLKGFDEAVELFEVAGSS
jgi:adenylate cyclase